MAKHYQFPLLVFLVVVHVKGGVAQHWHLDLDQEGSHELEESVGNEFGLSCINMEQFIKSEAIFLCGNPLAMGPIRHRRVKHAYLESLL
jgi:hypothetical protein